MLGMSSYERDYIDACRKKVEADLAAFDALAGAGLKKANEFESVFFNNMVIVLENLFVHRLRTKEGKDGNPLNEVRLLASSLTGNDGKLAADKQIRLKPETSVLGLAVGDDIKLTRDDFARLHKGFFDELESKYM